MSAEASGTWNGATGVAVTVLGLLLALAAIPPLDGARWWQIDGQTLARVPGAGSSGDGGDGIEVSRL